MFVATTIERNSKHVHPKSLSLAIPKHVEPSSQWRSTASTTTTGNDSPTRYGSSTTRYGSTTGHAASTTPWYDAPARLGSPAGYGTSSTARLSERLRRRRRIRGVAPAAGHGAASSRNAAAPHARRWWCYACCGIPAAAAAAARSQFGRKSQTLGPDAVQALLAQEAPANNGRRIDQPAATADQGTAAARLFAQDTCRTTATCRASGTSRKSACIWEH